MRVQKIHFLIVGAVLAVGVLLGGGVRRSTAAFIQTHSTLPRELSMDAAISESTS